MKLVSDAQDFISLLKNNREWLMTRTLAYAHQKNLTDPQKSLQEAWRNSLNEITSVIIHTLESEDSTRLSTDQMESVFLFGMMQAKSYRLWGNNLAGYLVQFGFQRQAYYDLLEQEGLDENIRSQCTRFLLQFFERMEAGCLNEWTTAFPQGTADGTDFMNPERDEEKHKYLTVFESLITPIILLDNENTILNFNLEAAKLFGLLKVSDDLQINSKLSHSGLKRIDEAIHRLIHKDTKEDIFETVVDTEEGQKYFNVFLKKSLDQNGRHKGSIIMLQDLTEQHTTAHNLREAKLRAEEADKLKTAFLANMSHEIRTPMNAIVGFTELLLNENYKETEQKEFLRLIKNSSRDLLHIIEDIIDIAKLESRQLKIKYKPCKVYDMLTDLLVVFQETLRRYGTQGEVELRLKVDKRDRQLIMFADGERLKQVLTNFLSNATKFTNEGNIEFGYRTVDESNLLFFVKDTGTGIPQNMKDRVFDRFFQLEEHQPLNFGGAGLGLAICKNIVTLMGGKIWMDSVLGQGSEFYFQLPLREAAKISPTSKAEVSRNVNDRLNLKNKCILVAEDDEINYQYLEEILVRTGARILRAENGLEAINLAESEEKIDLILMDIKMPQVDGIEATKYISAIRPDIPIIAQTAFAMEDDKLKCLQAGCTAYLTKPIERQKLYILLERYIQSNSLRESIVNTK